MIPIRFKRKLIFKRQTQQVFLKSKIVAVQQLRTSNVVHAIKIRDKVESNTMGKLLTSGYIVAIENSEITTKQNQLEKCRLTG